MNINIRHASTQPQRDYVYSDEDGTERFTNDFVHKFATNDGKGGDWFQNIRYDEELFYDEEYYYMCPNYEKMKRKGLIDDSQEQYLYRERFGTTLFYSTDKPWNGWMPTNPESVGFTYKQGCFDNERECLQFLSDLLAMDPSCVRGGHIRV